MADCGSYFHNYIQRKHTNREIEEKEGEKEKEKEKKREIKTK